MILWRLPSRDVFYNQLLHSSKSAFSLSHPARERYQGYIHSRKWVPTIETRMLLVFFFIKIMCGWVNPTDEFLGTCRGGMLSAAKRTTRASLKSWWELRTHWTNRFGSQLWFMNLAKFPFEPASMQNSGTFSSSLPWPPLISVGTATSLSLLCWQEKARHFYKKKMKNLIDSTMITAREKASQSYLSSIKTLHRLLAVNLEYVVVDRNGIHIVSSSEYSYVLTYWWSSRYVVPWSNCPTFLWRTEYLFEEQTKTSKYKLRLRFQRTS